MTKYYHSTLLSDILRYDRFEQNVGYTVTSMRTERTFALSQSEWAQYVDYPEIPDGDVEIHFLGMMDTPSVLEEYEQLAIDVSAWVMKGEWDLATQHIFRKRSFEDKMPEGLLRSIWWEHWTNEHRRLVDEETERRRKEKLRDKEA